MTFSTKASPKARFVLESLDVQNFAGIESAHFAPSATGVTVVHGSNEAGKSSLMNAFSLLLSDWKVSTTSKKVSAFFPVGSGAKPKITARLQLGENLVEYTKDFEKKKVLLDVLRPSVHNYTGDQAMEKFSELLNGSIDSALREALFVSQGQRLDALDFTAIPSLSSALRTAGDGSGDGAVGDSASAAGGISEGDQGAAELLVRLIDEEDKKLRDRRANRNSKGELADAETELTRAEEALAAAELEYNDAQAAIREIESKQIQRADAEDDLPDAQKEFDECAERLEAAKKVAEALSTLENELELKQDQVGRWKEASEAREKQKLAQGQLERLLKAATEELRGVQKKAEQQQTERDEAKKAFDSAHTAYVRAEKRAKLATALKNAAEVQGRLESAKEERDSAEKLDAKVAELAQKVDRNPATPKAEQRIREAMTDLDAQIKIRDAGATSVHIAGPVGGTVTDNGVESTLGESGLEKKVTTEWTVGLGEYEVRVTPAQDSSNLDLNVEEALQKVNAELSAVGLEPIALEDPRTAILEDFGRAVRARNEDEESLRDQRASLKAVLGKRALSDLNGQVESLTAEVERLRETCSALRSDANVDTGEDIDEAEATTALDAATRARDEANEKLLSLQNSDAIERKIQHEAKVENLQQQLDGAAKDLEAGRERYSDEDLKAKYTQAVQAVDVAREKLDSKRREVGELGDVEDVQASFEGARSRLNMLNQQVQECRVDIAALNAKLGQARGAAETKEQAEAQVERLEGVVARLRRQADSAELLHQVVQAARRRMQEKYSEPYRKALNKLSGIVFGSDVDLGVDERFQVSSRAIGNVRLDKEQLSGGAQEQVEILQLLAIARLVGHDGSGVPIFLDDVLGFSDTDRVKSMNKVLGALGRENQIIVLTCDKDRFSRIPGVNFQSIDNVKKAGASS
ncbi:AAA family ATPase [uncultured Corynebacterium sp.]|uniref:AAA family ATPase n=1 Tax=uncultured Corynebacterium sp. TaxID=159447 RepID=UPI0025E2B880|nr:AAA family ATPase [uncultured Corynebacterium sp.]